MRIATLRLIRVEDHQTEGTFGVLVFNGKVLCVTLEPPDRENAIGRSSIPAGQYTCTKFQSPKYGWTWSISNVPNRTYVLFHGGNVVSHTRGCILLAQYFGKLKGNRAVLNSGTTFKKFLEMAEDFDELNLTITEAY